MDDSLKKRLREAGSQGADLSPGDPLCNEALNVILDLECALRKAEENELRVLRSLERVLSRA